MFSPSDTIVAIATPPGRGALGIVRLSGAESHRIACKMIDRHAPLESRRATFATFRTAGGETLDSRDHVVVTFFPGPGSYTGDDSVELTAHGSAVVLDAMVREAVSLGARPANPGEFTLRAFLNGRLDLVQAEAVADLIDAATPLQARVAFDQLNGTLTQAIGAIHASLFDLIARLEASVDFPDEGYHFVEPRALGVEIDRIVEQIDRLLASAQRGRLIREGFQVAIVGSPNVGKSSLFNALVGADRAIVTEVAGTTRDLVSETIDLHGMRVTLVDTAGHRETLDRVEAEGVARSIGAARSADLVLLVLDATTESRIDYITQVPVNKRLIVMNKIDLLTHEASTDAVLVSATAGLGLDDLRRRIVSALGAGEQDERPALTNIRHIDLLTRARAALVRAGAAAGAAAPMPEEFVLADLQDARGLIEEVSGRRTPDDVLRHIFERFCIGK